MPLPPSIIPVALALCALAPRCHALAPPRLPPYVDLLPGGGSELHVTMSRVDGQSAAFAHCPPWSAGDVDGDRVADLAAAATAPPGADRVPLHPVAYALLRGPFPKTPAASEALPPFWTDTAGYTAVALYDSSAAGAGHPGPAEALLVCDVDGDGLDDVLVRYGNATTTGAVREAVVRGRRDYEGLGLRVDLAPIAHAAPPGSPLAWSCGDVNGDGVGDVLLQRGREVGVALGGRGGPLAGPGGLSSLPVVSLPAGAVARLVGDVDGDGHADMAVCSGGDSGDAVVELWFGHNFTDDDYEEGQWDRVRVRGPPVGAGSGLQVEGADLNGDGLSDVVVQGAAGDLRVLWGRSDRAFGDSGDAFLAFAGPQRQRRRMARLGDVNGDGADDLSFDPAAPGGDAHVLLGSSVWQQLPRAPVLVENASLAVTTNASTSVSMVPLALPRRGAAHVDDWAAWAIDGAGLSALTVARGSKSWRPRGAPLSLVSGAGFFGGVIRGRRESERFGLSADAVGDVDGDGCDDFVVVAQDTAAYGVRRIGRFVLRFGCPRGPRGQRETVLVGYCSSRGHTSRVASIGDYDGDGMPDFVVVTCEDLNVVFGTRTWPAMLPLAADGRQACPTSWRPRGAPLSLVSGAGFFGGVIRGRRESERFGLSADAVGDVDGDGCDDFVVVAQDTAAYGVRRIGRFVLRFGCPRGPRGQRETVLVGYCSSRGHTSRVASIGDYDGDGMPDFVVVTCEDLNVVFGTRTWPAMLPLAADGRQACPTVRTLILSNAGRTFANQWAGALGDVDGDACDDFVANTLNGAVVLYGGANVTDAVGSRRDIQRARHTTMARDEFPTPSKGFVAGDFDGDLLRDVELHFEDRVYVVYGMRGGWPEALSLDSPAAGVVVFTFDVTSALSTVILPPGDLDGDSLDDLVVAFSWFKFAVLYGSGDRDALRRIDPSNVAQDHGFVFECSVVLSGAFGVGDFNADGIDDIAVYERRNDDYVDKFDQQLTVVYGSRDRLALANASAVAAAATVFRFAHDSSRGDRLSLQGSRADVDGDGTDDLIVGFGPAFGDRGSVYVVSGYSAPALTLPASAQSGCCSASVGEAYAFALSNRTFGGRPVELSAVELPPPALFPLRFDAAAGAFSGVPRAAGLYAVRVSGTRDKLTAEDAFAVRVEPSLVASGFEQRVECVVGAECAVPSISVSSPSPTLSAVVDLSAFAGSARVGGGRLRAGEAVAVNGTRAFVQGVLSSLAVVTNATYNSSSFAVSVLDEYSQGASGRIYVESRSGPAPAQGSDSATAGPAAADGTSGPGSRVVYGAVFGTVVPVAVLVVAALVALAAWRRRARRREDVEMQSVIHFDPLYAWSPHTPAATAATAEDGAPYTVAPADEEDRRFVEGLYARCPVPGMELDEVSVVRSPAMERLFLARVEQLQQREGNAHFRPRWPAEKDQRRADVAARLAGLCAEYGEPAFPHVKVMPVWHGTTAKSLDSVFRSGYAALARTDGGFFGKGVYNAVEARYAYNVYCKGALLVNWVAWYSAFPVLRGDMGELEAKSNYQNYDAHFAPVSGSEAKMAILLPCDPQSAMFHELVVFETSQCLPRFLVTLKPVAASAASSAAASPLANENATGSGPPATSMEGNDALMYISKDNLPDLFCSGTRLA
eukprot:m51a1_g538 hypothetical protein (1646) ;mRNA; f:393452-399734